MHQSAVPQKEDKVGKEAIEVRQLIASDPVSHLPHDRGNIIEDQQPASEYQGLNVA